jgi:hypothetical protein
MATLDDERIDTQIRDGVSRFLALAGRMQDPRAGETIFDVMEAANAFARDQQTALTIYRPSACTQAAVDSYLEGMELIEESTDDFLAIYESGGSFDDFDSSLARTAGEKAGAAVRLLNESGC